MPKKFFLLEQSCFTLLCQFLLYGKLNHPYINIYPLFFGFPSHLGHDRALSRVPCAIQQVLISYLFYMYDAKFFKNLFIYFWLRWVFVPACRLSLAAVSGGYSLLRRAGFSLRWLLLLRSTGSRHSGFNSCGSRALERSLSSCGAWAQLLCGCGIFLDQGSNPCPLH